MHVISLFETRTTFLHCVLQSVPLSTKTNVFSLLTSAKFDPVIMTGIPSSPSMIDEASLLTLMISGSGVSTDRTVHLVLLVQAVHVTVENMVLQSKADSHPFFGSSSLLNFPLSHAVMVVQVKASEQTVHMVLTTAGIPIQVQPTYGVSTPVQAAKVQPAYGVSTAVQAAKSQPAYGVSTAVHAGTVQPADGVSTAVHVGTVQHSSPWSVHQVQTVVDGFADCVEEQVIESPSVFFLPQTPQDVSKLQVPSNIFSSGYVGQPVHDLKIQFASSFDLKLNDFAL